MLFDSSDRAPKRVYRWLVAALVVGAVGGLVFALWPSEDGFNPLPGETASTAPYKHDAEQAVAALEANPRDEDAALKLARARVQIAQLDGIVPQSGGQINTEKSGLRLINEAITSWERYMSFGPAKPDAGVAMQYVGLFGIPTVARYDDAARALEAALITREPSPGLYAQLAVYNLVAGDREKYREARARALDLSETAERRKEIKKYLDDVKDDIDKRTRAAAKSAGQSGSSTIPKLPTLPAFGG